MFADPEKSLAAPPPDLLHNLYLRHRRGGWFRSAACAAMGLVAGAAYGLGYLGAGQLLGIIASIVVLILMQPLTLGILARARNLRFIKHFSLSMNLLEVLIYTAVIHFVGGLAAAYLCTLYFVLIAYLGMTAPRQVPFLIATWCVICLLVMVILETSGLLPVTASTVLETDQGGSPAWYNQLIIVGAIGVALMVMAYVSSFTSDALRQVRHRLRETNLELERELDQHRRDQEELRRNRDLLETRVEERTAKLTELNRRLTEEILERKQTELALRKSQDRYALATKAARIGVWDWDLTTGRFDADPGISKILGYEPDRIKDLSMEWAGRVVHPDDRDKWMEVALAVQQGKLDDYEVEYRARHVDGTYFWHMTRASVIRDTAGTPIKVVGSTIDIDDRKKIEANLQASEQKFIAAFKSSPAMVSLSSLDEGRFLDVNEVFLKVLAYTRDEVIGRTADKLSIWAAPGGRQMMLEKIRDGEVRDLEVPIRDKYGVVHQMLWSGTVIEIDGQNILLTSAVDITDRIQAEQERNRLITELRQALDKVQTLRGLIPICSVCKKIRDDEGYWHQVEAYVKAHSEAEFSHGLCPDCIQKFYPEYVETPEAEEQESGP